MGIGCKKMLHYDVNYVAQHLPAELADNTS
jgi:hypothetical protein